MNRVYRLIFTVILLMSKVGVAQETFKSIVTDEFNEPVFFSFGHSQLFGEIIDTIWLEHHADTTFQLFYSNQTASVTRDSLGWLKVNQNNSILEVSNQFDRNYEVIFNLNLDLGDSIRVYEESRIVKAIDTVDDRKIITFDNFLVSYQDVPTQFIEGYGPNESIMRYFQEDIPLTPVIGLCKFNNDGMFLFEHENRYFENCEVLNSVTSLKGEYIFKVSPNPLNSNSKIIFDQSYSGEINIYNSVGTIVHQQSLSNVQYYDLPVSELDEGIYFIQATNYPTIKVLK